MKASIRLAWVVVVPTCVAAVAVAYRAYARTRDDAAVQSQRAALLSQESRELVELKPVANQWEARRRPASGLAALLSETLTGCGVPAATLTNVSPQPEMAVQGGPGSAGADLKRQRATFTLVPITLPQLGAFLDAWRQREPYWTVASIDVGPEPIKQNDTGTAGRDLPLRAVLTLDAIYLDEPKGDRR